MFCPDQQLQIVIAESAKVFNILAMLLNVAEFACYIAIFWDQASKICDRKLGGKGCFYLRLRYVNGWSNGEGGVISGTGLPPYSDTLGNSKNCH